MVLLNASANDVNEELAKGCKVWCILVIIMVCTNSKDFSKLFTIKYGTAMIAKVIAMMFPIVTWFLDIGVFL